MQQATLSSLTEASARDFIEKSYPGPEVHEKFKEGEKGQVYGTDLRAQDWW